MEVEKIEHDGETLGIIIRGDTEVEGVNFVSGEDSPLQLGISKYEKGKLVKPHKHKPVVLEKSTITSLEVVHIDSGEVRVDFYTENGVKVTDRVLKSGDTILLSGAHGMKMIKDTKIIEVKQGPYRGVENDKEFFD